VRNLFTEGLLKFKSAGIADAADEEEMTTKKKKKISKDVRMFYFKNAL